MKIDVAQNRIDDFFFLTLPNKYEGTGLLSEKMEALHAKLNERAKAATSSYSAAINFIEDTYSVLVSRNH